MTRVLGRARVLPGLLAMLSIAASTAPVAQPAAPTCVASGRLDDASTAAFVECARAATRKYQDRAAAILDGYRLIGRDFPAMGEHWIHVGRLFDGTVDPHRPEVLNYIVVSGVPTLIGVAYALPLLKGETPPEWPAGQTAWHDHFRTVEDETVSPAHHVSGQAANASRLVMVHAWLWLPNPEGLFAADNWAIPYQRLGLMAPAGAPASAAKALSLATGGADYFMMAIEAAVALSPADRVAVQANFDRARSTVDAVLRERSGLTLTADDAVRLSTAWTALWTAIDTGVSPAAREHLRHLASPSSGPVSR
jgi:hypothetical protein